MAVQTYTDAVVVDGSQDIAQLRVQAHSSQNQALQAWEDAAGTPLAQMTHDGRLEIGNQAVNGVAAALIEANQDLTATSAVKQGLQSRGIVGGVGAVTEPITWSVQELEIGGTGGVDSNHTALSSKITHNNTGSSSAAEMRAANFTVENNQALNKAVAVRAEINNASVGNLTEAAAFEAVMPSAGSIGILYGLHIPDLPTGLNHYAIHTGRGPVHLGDAVGIGTVPSAQLHVAQEGGTLNPILENAVSAAAGNTLAFRRARNTLAAKALVNTGDYAGRLSFEAWDGSAYQCLASIDALVAATPGANDMPGKLVFSVTPDGSATPVAALTINANGNTDLKIADFTNSAHNHQNAAGGGTLNTAAIGSGTLALARGGTNADLSATGGTGHVLKQTSGGGPITVAGLAASEIPVLPASQITSGQLALARGGTNADLSATGGTGKVLKQTTVGGAVTVATLSASEIPPLDAAAISSGTLNTARIPSLDALKIGSGVLNNARVNWAAPGDIGGTTPSSAVFASLTVNSQAGVNGNVQAARPFFFFTNNSARWLIYADAANEAGGNVGSDLRIARYNNDGTFAADALKITRSNGTVDVTNALTAGVKPFLIDHPLDPLNKNLMHVAIEGPRADLIYRGKVQLVKGVAQVSIDAASNMTAGTFEALTHHVEAEVFVQNKTGWANVRGEVVGGILHIECQDPASSDTVTWLVVAERADAFMQASDLTDVEGHFMVEANKPMPTPEDLQALNPRFDESVTEVSLEVVTLLNGKRGYPIHPAAYGMALPTREVRPSHEGSPDEAV